MDSILTQLQTIVVTAAAAAVTALCAYLFNWLRTYLGIVESDSNEGEIRRAALTEAGKLVQMGSATNPNALADSVSKVFLDLPKEISAEGYDTNDVKDMIIGAAATIFPPAGLLKLIMK